MFPPIIVKQIVPSVANAVADFVGAIFPVVANLFANFLRIRSLCLEASGSQSTTLTLNRGEPILPILAESFHAFATAFLSISDLLFPNRRDPFPLTNSLRPAFLLLRSFNLRLFAIPARQIASTPVELQPIRISGFGLPIQSWSFLDRC
jgi:hypothetical protein